MRSLENLNSPAPFRHQVDPVAFWEARQLLLEQQGVDALAYVAKRLKTAEMEIWEMPDELFDPRGDAGSPLRETHRLLITVLENPEPDSEVVAELFPYWETQLEDARDWAGTL